MGLLDEETVFQQGLSGPIKSSIASRIFGWRIISFDPWEAARVCDGAISPVIGPPSLASNLKLAAKRVDLALGQRVTGK